VQLVISAHQHRVSYYAPAKGRSWAQIVGGGCTLQSKNPNSVPSVIEGSVKDGKLAVTIHDVAHNKVWGEFKFG
jgi:vancomycin resistance protein YoaR